MTLVVLSPVSGTAIATAETGYVAGRTTALNMPQPTGTNLIRSRGCSKRICWRVVTAETKELKFPLKSTFAAVCLVSTSRTWYH